MWSTTPTYTFRYLQAVVFDWGGTLVDCGCQGPVQAFREAFALHALVPTEEEIRQPMGMGKRDHVAVLLAIPRLAAAWQTAHGALPDERAIDTVYGDVERIMEDVIDRFSQPVPGAVEVIQMIRSGGLCVGSCTGYPRSVGERLARGAADQGLTVDCLICATDVPQSRPQPDMCLKALKQLGIANPHRTVKIGDTAHDMEEGRKAGMWTIGLSRTGNRIGCSAEELNRLPPTEIQHREIKAMGELRAAQADFIVPDVAASLEVLKTIDRAGSAHR